MKLLALRRFQCFKWWVPKQTVERGGHFGDSALENITENDEEEEEHSQNFLEHEESAIAMQDTFAVVINRNFYLNISKKCQNKSKENTNEIIRQIPLFS